MGLSTIALFALGFAVLVIGAEMLVRGATRLAVSMGVSPLVVGLTVVAYGTSSPELAVSTLSALRGSADIALGNVVGSNICNVLLILGLSAAVTPLAVSRQLIRWDVPLMIGISVLVFLLGLDGRIGRLDGIILFAGCAVYTIWTIRQSRRETRSALTPDNPEPSAIPADSFARRWFAPAALILLGLGMLVLGANWLVNGAIVIARFCGISELVIGLTIVAVGTSLPEIATSLMAGIRGQRDIAVGNAVGSNIFNILLVLGLTASVAGPGIAVPADALRFDLPVMIAVAVACLPIFITGGIISRSEGIFFLLYYSAYTGYLLLKASQNRTDGPLDAMAMIFVVPPILVGIVLTLRFVHRRVRRPA
jgi:cation:H+ antiporter